jgi:hypothetical protein
VTVENRSEVYGLKLAEFRDWLIERFRDERGELPSEPSLRRVMAAL